MNNDQERSDARPRPTFRATLVRVMIVQVVTLVILWILQSRYGA